MHRAEGPRTPDPPHEPRRPHAAVEQGSALPPGLPQVHPEQARTINLPPRLTSLIGRDADLLEITTLLAESATRLVTLTGPGGVGKTRLAVEAGYALADDLRSIQFVPLAAVSEPHGVLPAIARAIGVPAEDPRDPLPHIPAAFRAGRTLLILDTMEQVVAAAADLQRLLERAPTLSILVTSREALHVPGERVHEVAVLDTPPDDSDPGEFAAVALFVAEVQRFDLSFTLDRRTAPIVAAICRQLDGLPLAIELAAARVKLFSLDALLDRLTEHIDILGGGPRDQPAHQRTMRATIAWSYALLSAEEQTVFRALSWFGTPFTQDAAEVMVRSGGGQSLDAFDRIARSLADKHLLRVVPTQDDGETVYLMLMTVRIFGRECSRILGEESALRDAHAAWIAGFTTQALLVRRDGGIDSSVLPAIERSYPDIERALQWLEAQRQSATLLALAIALAPYWTHRFARADGRRWFERALAQATPATPESLVARAKLELAALSRTSRSSDLVEATRIARQSLEHYRRLDDPLGEVSALNMIGVLHRALGSFEGATAAFTEALDRSDALELPWWQALIRCNLGATALWRGETREARQRLEEAARQFRDLDDRRGIAFTLHILALVRCAQGDARTAALIAAEALEHARAIEAQETTIDLVAAAGVIAAAGGEFGQALTLLTGADILAHRAMYRSERPERALYEDAERIARRALGPGQADAQTPDAEHLTLADAVVLAREALAGLTAPPLSSAMPRPGTVAPLETLTIREHQVLALMAQRYTDKEIAQTLQISVRTVSRHVSNVFSKLGVRSRRDVALRFPAHPDDPGSP